MIVLPVMAIVACSSNKNADNGGSKGMLGVGTGVSANGGNDNTSPEGQAHLQMQQLQQNNIVYFDLDKYDIYSDSTQMLDACANSLRNNPSYKVTVEGHADERGTPEYNISLGGRRASAVKMYLRGRDVSTDQISIVSYGKEKPTVLGHDEAAYAKGRRVILVYQENCTSSNFRHQLLSSSLLAGIAAPWTTSTQAPISNIGSGSVEDRVTQFERISNAHSQLLTQFQQQLSDNQSDIDSLRGRIQESQCQLNQVVERQKQTLLRIDSLSSGGAATQSVSDDQGGVAASATPAADTGTTNAGVSVKGGDVNTDHSAAIALIQDKSRQDDAMVVFQNLIKNCPDSTYLPNTNYWLGQLNYNKGKKDDATYYLASVVKSYPKSPKAADTMFKAGIIMQDEGNAAKTKAVYQQVINKYPDTDDARQAQKRLSAVQCIIYDQKSHYLQSCRASHKQLNDLHRNFCCVQV